MAGPVKPVKLESGHTYVHVTSAQSPNAIMSSANAAGISQLKYVGPIGELDGEHIFEIIAGLGDLKSAERAEKPTLEAIKRIEGVKAVKSLEVKQRAKRGEF